MKTRMRIEYKRSSVVLRESNAQQREKKRRKRNKKNKKAKGTLVCLAASLTASSSADVTSMSEQKLAACECKFACLRP